MAQTLVNFAISLFGGVPQLLQYVFTHVLGTEKGTELYNSVLPLVEAALAAKEAPAL